MKFTKMQALGNDFMVINGIERPFDLSSSAIARLADRRFGVGFDQLLLLEPASRDDADFIYRIFNADGGEVSQCGNGARCLARYIAANRLSDKKTLVLETRNGLVELLLQDNGMVIAKLNEPKFLPSDIPFLAESTLSHHELPLSSGIVRFSVANVGNPHAVITVEDITLAPVAEIGAELSVHEAFPEDTNVGFMQVIDSRNIALRVYERGAAETLACGSGACAAVAVGIRNGLLEQEVTVRQKGGDLKIGWPDAEGPIEMVGSGEFVFAGEML